ncbi:hypothetical protein CO134_03910, partial [Candidatus Kuenenbacteria bacterium CG_4_9_14_3_um_filter_39_14]
EKIGRAQIKKCRENFFVGLRALASGGGAKRQNSQSGFSSKKVRILTKRHRQLGNEAIGSPATRARQPILSANWNFLSLPRYCGTGQKRAFRIFILSPRFLNSQEEFLGIVFC